MALHLSVNMLQLKAVGILICKGIAQFAMTKAGKDNKKSIWLRTTGFQSIIFAIAVKWAAVLKKQCFERYITISAQVKLLS